MTSRGLLTSALLAPALLVYVMRATARVVQAPFLALAASVPDDTFYYLLPALNFRETHTFTFDRLHPTYGFQPLWELVLVVLAYLVPDREAFLRAVLVLCSLLRALTAVALAGAAQGLCGSLSASSRSFCALAAALLFLGNEPHGAIAMGGKESALYGLLLACALWLCVRPAASDRTIHSAALGTVLAAMVLARVTPASVLVVLALAAWRLRRGAHTRALIAGFVVPVAAWAAYAAAAFGTVFPTSGSVKLLASQGVLRTLEPAAIPQVVLAGVFPYLKEVLQLSVGVTSRFWEVAASPLQALLAAWCLVGLLAALFWTPARQRTGPMLWLLGVALAGSALVPMLLFGRAKELYYFAWYVNEVPILVALVAAVSLPAALSGRLAGWASASVAVLFALRAWTVVGSPPAVPVAPSFAAAVIEASQFAKRELGVTPETRLAAFDAGLLGYLLPSHVINLDALANDDRYWAMRQGVSDLRYLRRERVEYLVNVNLPRTWFTAIGDVLREYPARVHSAADRLVVLRLDFARPCHEGFQHAGSCDLVYGWAWDCARPDDRVELEILDGEKVIAKTRADIFEPHLRRAGIGDGRHGFQVDLELPRDGSVHSITVRAAGSGLALHGAPMSFGCSR